MVVGAQPDDLSGLKSATGTGQTVICLVTVVLPLAFVVVNLIVYFPGVLKNTTLVCVLLNCVLTSGGTPPKSQSLVTAPVPTSENDMANCGHPEVEEAEITGAGACAYPLLVTTSIKREKKRSFLNNGSRFKV